MQTRMERAAYLRGLLDGAWNYVHFWCDAGCDETTRELATLAQVPPMSRHAVLLEAANVPCERVREA